MRKKHRNQEICETNQEIWKKIKKYGKIETQIEKM